MSDTARAEKDGWSCTLNRHDMADGGEVVSAWLTAPDGRHVHSERTRFDVSEKDALKAIEVIGELLKNPKFSQ